jgi:uncharacterized membrane protein YphA (DoxX/SURF4 family)
MGGTMSENVVSRKYLSALRILLGVILLVTWVDNLGKGLYTPLDFQAFILELANGHPLGFYGAFLENVIAANAGIFAVFQMVAELLLGLALLTGTLTRLAGLGAAAFFFNLFLAYTNPSLGEWIWTYVMLLALALVVSLGAAGRAWGLDQLLLQRRGEPKLPVY